MSSCTLLPPIYTKFYRANLFDAFLRILVSLYLGDLSNFITNLDQSRELFPFSLRFENSQEIESLVNVKIEQSEFLKIKII